MVSVPGASPGAGSRGSGTTALPPPPLWVMQLALFQAKKKKNSERHHVLHHRIQYHCYNEDQYEVYA